MRHRLAVCFSAVLALAACQEVTRVEQPELPTPVFAITPGYGLVMTWWRASNVYQGSTEIPPRGWHHIALTYNGSGFDGYVDGAVDATSSFLGAELPGDGGGLGIGRHQSEPFKGLIDEVRVYDRPLSASEVQTLACASCPSPPTSGLLSWWPGDGNALDVQGGHHATMVNGAGFGLGILGQAFTFDGVDDWVRILDYGYPEASQFTIAAWIWIDDSDPLPTSRWWTIYADDSDGFWLFRPLLPPPDPLGPVTSGVVATPNPIQVDMPLNLTALVDDGTTGGSIIASAEYSLDDGANWIPMDPVDGTFDEVSEDVTWAVDPFLHPAVVDACVRGTDAVGNTGAEACVLLAAFDPTGGFATGAGWIQSQDGAYKPDENLAGKAHFGFVSRYQKGETVPDGHASFRFQVADLDFRSTTYDWLVVNQGGSNAQFKGSGTINDGAAPTGEDYRFMIWAGDKDPDTFRVRIWYENGGEIVIYDNGFQQEIGGGNIQVHQ